MKMEELLKKKKKDIAASFLCIGVGGTVSLFCFIILETLNV